jgi:hypothetical protein
LQILSLMSFLKNTFRNFYVFVSIVGVILILYGFELESNDKAYGILISTFGGSLLGSCVSLFFDVIKQKSREEQSLNILSEMQVSSNNVMTEIRDVIKNSFHQDPIRSHESEIEKFHQKFYLYYITTSEEGAIFWNSCQLDFSSKNHIGVLKTKSFIQNIKGEEFEYEFEGFKRGPDHPFAIIHTAITLKGKEKNGQYVFPIDDKRLNENKYYGIQYHHDWKNESAVSAAILMNRMAPNCNTLGKVDDTVALDLQREWDEHFGKMVKCLRKYTKTNSNHRK